MADRNVAEIQRRATDLCQRIRQGQLIPRAIVRDIAISLGLSGTERMDAYQLCNAISLQLQQCTLQPYPSMGKQHVDFEEKATYDLATPSFSPWQPIASFNTFTPASVATPLAYPSLPPPLQPVQQAPLRHAQLQNHTSQKKMPPSGSFSSAVPFSTTTATLSSMPPATATPSNRFMTFQNLPPESSSQQSTPPLHRSPFMGTVLPATMKPKTKAFSKKGNVLQPRPPVPLPPIPANTKTGQPVTAEDRRLWNRQWKAQLNTCIADDQRREELRGTFEDVFGIWYLTDPKNIDYEALGGFYKKPR